MNQPRLNQIRDLATAAKRGDDAALGRLNRQAIDLILELIAAIEQACVMHHLPASGPWQTRSTPRNRGDCRFRHRHRFLLREDAVTRDASHIL
jgi:hypothetical protein